MQARHADKTHFRKEAKRMLAKIREAFGGNPRIN